MVTHSGPPLDRFAALLPNRQVERRRDLRARSRARGWSARVIGDRLDKCHQWQEGGGK